MLKKNEKITISAKQFIISNYSNRSFGDDFNFVWPRLKPGINNLSIDGDGNGSVCFTYRYPMKVGDCAMDIGVYGGNITCGEMTAYDTIKWENIIGTPTSLGGYGITDAYTMSDVYNKVEVDNKIDKIEISGGSGSTNIVIDEKELNDMFESILG